MTADDTRRGPDRQFRPAGIGSAHTWRCMGCGQSRPSLGARGVGVRRRCAVCVAKKGAA